jgi:UPF0755 protein
VSRRSPRRTAALLRAGAAPPPPRQAPPRHRGLGLVFTLLAVIVVLLGAAGGTLVLARLELRPVSASQMQGVPVRVGEGESLQALATSLESRGLIRSATWFAAYARLRGLRLRAGTYLLDPGMGASEILLRLDGTDYAAPHRVTIPDGLDAAQVASRVGASGIGISSAQYLVAASEAGYSAPFLRIRPAGDTSLEGFLFPDTYTVPAGTTARQLIQMQLNEFAKLIAPVLPSDPQQAYTVLTVASMLEAESLPGDFTKVASVIHNRLDMGMRLQIDATVMYGLEAAGRAPSNADLGSVTLYNTYVYSGLPPTPITSPGLAAVQAAAHPASTPYLYYVTDTCGHTYYSVTEAQHEQQVQEYEGRCNS